MSLTSLKIPKFYSSPYPECRTLASNLVDFLLELDFSSEVKLNLYVGRIMNNKGTDVFLPVTNDIVIDTSDASLKNGEIAFNAFIVNYDHKTAISALLRYLSSREIAFSTRIAKIYKKFCSDGSVIYEDLSNDDIRYVKPNDDNKLLIYQFTGFMHVCVTSDTMDIGADDMRDSIVEHEDLFTRFIITFIVCNIKFIITCDYSPYADVVHNETYICISIVVPPLHLDNLSTYEILSLFRRCPDAFLNTFTSAKQAFSEVCTPENVRRAFMYSFSHFIWMFTRSIVSELAMDSAMKSHRNSLYVWPFLFGDEISSVREHYNKKRITDIRYSEIKLLRSTNNNVKRFLIHEYVKPGTSLLDLACGHAQDLLKLTEKRLCLMIGIDISEYEILEAKRRLKHENMESPYDLSVYHFYVGNMLQPQSYEKYLVDLISDESCRRPDEIVHQPLIKFNTVSVQLAIHYCLLDRASAELVIANISKYLAVGGHFIGSCPSSLVIMNQLCNNLRKNICQYNSSDNVKYSFGNNLYSVSFEHDDFVKKFDFSIEPGSNRVLDLRCRKYFDLFALSTACSNVAAKTDVDAKLDSLANDSSEADFNVSLADRLRNTFADYGEVLNHNSLDSSDVLISADDWRKIGISDIAYAFNHVWGLQYHFWLKNHIDEDEYVVPWVSFCDLCAKYNLRCILRENFVDYYLSMVDKAIEIEKTGFKYTASGCRVSEQLERKIADSRLLENSSSESSAHQAECIRFYQVFAFEKLA